MSSSSHSCFHVRSLDFYYGKLHALKNVSLEIRDRNVTALIGPSGCGKSTLLRVFNRIYSLYPDQQATGEVLLHGENILDRRYDVNLLRSRVGMVMQRPTPFPMSVFDNVAYGLRLSGRLRKGLLQERVEWALQRAALLEEVKDRLNRNANQLSGGQQQRLCIARAIATKPEVLCLDEATSALDPLSTQKVEDLIAELKRDFTIVIVTHNMQQARRISDQTGFMFLGEMVELNDTKEIFSNPQQQMTREYVSGRYG